jgi:DAK2 domain fusion protein YloV
MDVQPVDAGALRRWAGAALAVLGRSREEIDALNVFPIADSDTGTNMYLTFEAACRNLDDRLTAPGPAPSVPEALQALAHGALLGARGNSGVILSQLLRGAARARYTGLAVDGNALATGLAAASELAYEAVARPAEGTILSVASAAAEAASAAAASMAELAADLPSLRSGNESLAFVAHAAAAGAREALARTPDQLEVLRRAGVVDAGGLGLVIILETLAAYTGGADPRSAFRQRRLVASRTAAVGTSAGAPQSPGLDPSYEVIYLLDAADAAITGPAGLRAGLDEFCEAGGGDSLVVVGGGDLWRVHVHVDDPGVPIEMGIAAGRPYDIKITHFGDNRSEHADAAQHDLASAPASRPTRAVVAVAYGPGLAALFQEAGAQVLLASAGRPPSAADFERAVVETRAAEVVLLPNDTETTVVAAAVAERFGGEWAGEGRAVRRPAGARPVRVAAVPAKVTVQGIAALAVHEPARRFDADVVAMTAAAGATRYGAVEVAETEAWTMAGVCRAGQALGHVENDIALIEDDQAAAASAVLERMLSAGGEMVTLVMGERADPGMAEAISEYLRDRHPVVDVVVYEGGQAEYPLLIGVE